MTAKTNTLKLVPFAMRRIQVEGVPYEDWPLHPVMLEYTYGKPGEQPTDDYGRYSNAIDWRPNEPFSDTLTLDRLERGRSAARFWFVGSDGTHYPFFGQGFVDALKRTTSTSGAVHGTFIAVKRGANYGLELVSE